MKKIYFLFLIGFLMGNHSINAEATKTPIIISSENLQKALMELHQDLLTDLQANRNDCEVLRQNMDVLIAHLGYTPIFIVGEKGKYYKEGMHQEFYKEPKPLKTKYNRNPLAEQLELTHIDLYHCDKGLYNRIARLAELTSNSSAEKMEALHIALNERLHQLSLREQRRLKRKKRQLAWLQGELPQLLKWESPIKRPSLLSKPLDNFINKEEITKETDKASLITKKTVEKTISNHAFLLFPNPNHGQFRLEMNTAWSDQATLTIIDISGRVILSKKVMPNGTQQIVVDLPNIASGAYFARLKDKQKEWQRLFVVE